MPWSDDSTHSGPDLPRWGRYILRGRLGSGAQGNVFRAWHPGLERESALKLLALDARGIAFSDSLLREARALARVKHPHVVNVYDVDELEGQVGISMELINGQTLEDVLQKQGRFGAREAVNVGVDVGHALAAVHAAGLVHRDVKARNVMRENTGRIVLMDFGMGRDDAQLKAAGGGDLAGTPLYMAPEVFAGAPASQQSDIYSVGVLLYHLLTGKYPVEGETFDEIARAHRHGRRTPIIERRPDLPDAFVAVLDRALAPNPEDRHRSAGQLVHELVAWEHATAAGPDVPWPRWLASKALVVLSTVVLVTLLGFFTSQFFNALLERTIADESVLDWTVWGLWSLIAPIFNMVQMLLIPTALIVMWRLARRLLKPADRWSRRAAGAIRGAAHRVGLDAPHNVAYLAAGASVIGLISVVVLHWQLVSTLIIDFRVISAMTAEQLALLSRDNREQHYAYRWNLEWVLAATGWALYRFWRIRRERPLDVDLIPIVALASTLAFTLVMWSAPYRIFFQSEMPRIEVAGQRCYDLGRRQTEVQIYCPESPQPKVRRVAVNTAGLRDTGITESIFARK